METTIISFIRRDSLFVLFFEKKNQIIFHLTSDEMVSGGTACPQWDFWEERDFWGVVR